MKKTIFFLIIALLLIGLCSIYQPQISIGEAKRLLEYPNSKYLMVDGQKIHYYDQGKGEVLLLLHGNGGNIHQFDLMKEELSKRYRVIAYDNIGHGLTGPDKALNYSSDNFVHFLDKIVETLNLTNITLIGNSFGGFISTLYTQKHTEKVKRLILIDSYGGTCAGEQLPNRFKPENLPFVSTFSKYFLPKAMVKSALQDCLYHPVSEKALDDTYHTFSIEGNRLYRKEFAKFEHPRNVLTGKNITCPILILSGEFDKIQTPCQAKDIESILSNDTLVIIKDAGHLPMYDEPVATNKIILDFLIRNP